MPTTGDAARVLAERLRALRKTRWPDRSITQAELADALSQRKPTSVQLVSSWERIANPTPPPEDRLNAIATFFSTRRSLEGKRFRLIDDDALTEAEAEARDKLRRELLDLRHAAVWRTPAAESSAHDLLRRDPWHLPDDAPITIVCAELPEELRKSMPFSGWSDPDRAELSWFADLDSLFELHGHLRAVNPDADVRLVGAPRLRRDDMTAHLVLVGGVDWNAATQDTMRRTGVPVRQHSDDHDPSRGFFQVVDGNEGQSFAPLFEDRGTDRVLVQDVGHFLRAPNPLNRDRTVTVCNGMYGAGVFGAVRTLTDKTFRKRNADYLANTFAGQEALSLLFRVHLVNGAMVATPDWTARNTVLHTWSEAPS